MSARQSCAERVKLTDRREDELIKSDTLKCWHGTRRLRHREGLGKESKPLELYRGHDETIEHEANKTLEIERRRQAPRSRYQSTWWPGQLFI